MAGVENHDGPRDPMGLQVFHDAREGQVALRWGLPEEERVSVVFYLTVTGEVEDQLVLGVPLRDQFK